MNVSCTHCDTTFRVDPKKVPSGGVQARCSVCSGVFFVPEAEETRSYQPAPPPQPARVPKEATPRPVARPPVVPAPPPPATQMPAATVPPPATAPPPAPPSQRAFAAAPPPAVARPINPFLAQDPATKARRLARALISDLVVYHPAKRADGLRDGSLKILFEEEIQKCWEEYTEQVGEEMANSTGYFTEALNEILADGRPVFP